VAIPTSDGAYWRMTLARPWRKMAPPPWMAAVSLKFEEAISIGSRKCPIR